jgi:AraC-like DNA-binding protein
VTSIVKSIESLGADVERLVASCGLASIWSNPNLAALPEDHVWRLFERSAHSLDMPDVGLRIGAGFHVRDLGMFGRKLESSLTTYSCLREYIKTVNRYSSHSKFWIEQQEGGVWFCRRGIDLIDVGRNEVEQFALELMIRLVQLGCGPKWMPRGVRVQHAENECFLEHPAYGCVTLHCGQPVTAIWISDVDSVRLVRWRDDDITGCVRDYVRAGLQDSKPDLASVAQRLGFSVRTLQRELSDRGLDWSRLLDQVRMDHAAQSLAGETPICEIAQSLGYTDQANFGRAFRRWTGTTPHSYRKQVHHPEN